MKNVKSKCCVDQIENINASDWPLSKKGDFLFFKCGVCKTDYRIPVKYEPVLDFSSIKMNHTTEGIARPEKVKVGDVLITKNQYRAKIGSDSVVVVGVQFLRSSDSKQSLPHYDVELRGSDNLTKNVNLTKLPCEMFALNLMRHKDQFLLGS